MNHHFDAQDLADNVGMEQYSFFGGFGDADEGLEGGLEVRLTCIAATPPLPPPRS